MYFLRWLYREVNPMMLILGLVTLYFLFNLATCSKSADSIVPDTTNVSSERVKKVAKLDTGTENTESDVETAELDPSTDNLQVAVVDEQEANSGGNTTAATNTKDQPVESALSKVFKNEQAGNELNADMTAEAQSEATRPSILNRVFKKAEEAVVVQDDVVAEVSEGSKTAAVVATGAAVATAGAVTAVVADEVSTTDEVETKVAAAEEVTEAESEDKGGFFGLFNRSKDKDEIVAADEGGTEAEVVVADEIEEQVEVEITDSDVEVAVVEEAEAEAEPNVEVIEAAPVEQMVVETEKVVKEAVATESVTVVEEAEVVQQEITEEPLEVAVATTAEAPQTLTQSESVPPPPSYSANVSSDQAALSAARRAYWDRDYATADSLYSEMIAKEASNPELIAEYGNMLLQSGQVEKTLDAYETAAGLMIDSGRKQEAKPLIDYISSWDQGRADALINKVFAQ